MYPAPIQHLIDLLKNLPGVGRKTAERYAFSLLQWDEGKKELLTETIENLSTVMTCEECGCYREVSACLFCKEHRDLTTLVVLAHPKEAYSFSHLTGFQGGLHILGGLLSPLDGIGPEILRIDALLQRIKARAIQEVVIALDTTLEGDATALYLSTLLKEHPVSLTRIAHGVPMGSSLEYVDEHTLFQAFASRRALT